ncbi:glyoxalase [Sphingomonas oleivorans]|uniref:Glyoxalase n=1 Tax=Sphingomonas oleivorans TaxID=1735121 RepID=A0A2T5FVE3_9SPHN|nr:VOC family protein [Sphingomonas oleivorans]PTQ09416.1 glyoxalase [Sphingomonas oleivorans]
MSDIHGRFVWYELISPDREASKRFYGDVMGWGAEDTQMPGMVYTMFNIDGTPVAGLMDLPEPNARPGWTGYVAVDDVDGTVEQVKRLGGSVHVPPTDIADVGRFSIVADPQGAVLALFTSLHPERDQPAAPGAPARVGWHELAAVDWEKAFAFYSELFGWQKAEGIDMGEMGIYQLFSAGGQPIGGMFNKPPTVPAPAWLFYVNIGDIDAAIERVKAGGGQILNGPMQVPGGDWIVQSIDPQGAMFALVGKRG